MPAITTAIPTIPAATALLALGAGRGSRGLAVLTQPNAALDVVHPVPMGRLGHLDRRRCLGGFRTRVRFVLRLRGPLETLHRLLRPTGRARGSLRAPIEPLSALLRTPPGFLARFLAGFVAGWALLALWHGLTRFTRFALAAPATTSRSFAAIVAPPTLSPFLARTLLGAFRTTLAASPPGRRLGSRLPDVGIELGQATGVLVVG